MNTLFDQMSQPGFEPNLDLLTDEEILSREAEEQQYQEEMKPKILAERARLEALGFSFDEDGI